MNHEWLHRWRWWIERPWRAFLGILLAVIALFFIAALKHLILTVIGTLVTLAIIGFFLAVIIRFALFGGGSGGHSRR